VTGHSHLQTSSTFSAKVGKMAEAQLVASVVFQELLAPPRCKSDDEWEYMAKLLLQTEMTPVTRITGYFENLSDSRFKKNSKEKKYVCG